MRTSRLSWQLFTSYAAITLAALLAIGGLATHALQQFYLQTVRDHLHSHARLLEQQLAGRFDPARREDLEAAARQFRRSTNSRVTLILPSGEVLVDTDEDPAVMDNHADRPEFAAALAGQVGMSERYSTTLHQPMTYLALPVRRGGRIVGAVRTALPSTALDRAMRGVQWRIASGGLAIAALSALAGLWFARRVSRPLEDIRRGAERFASGNLGYKLTVPPTEEMAGVAESLNRMAHELKERIRNTVRQNTEQEAVLASMVEGVLAVDNDQRVISLNHAAAELLGSPQDEAQGRPLHEVIRNADLRRFVARVLASEGAIEGDVLLSSGQDRVLQAHGTALRDVAGHGIGAVIVLNDITRLRRLENLRRDFVANVSHELKTPITSIKGYAETLLDGAMADPDDAQRFLRIIAKQADRLNSIIEDLLSLSKIEQGELSGSIALSPNRVKAVVEEAVLEIAPLAAERKIAIRTSGDAAIQTHINPPLLEQAVLNLLDNAVKYSEPGSEVTVFVAESPDEVSIAVRDQGCGIDPAHHSRLFERFYRVDKARSRKLGGTGLGLAIVKHIVMAHLGQIDVDSAPGKGSTFTVRLPTLSAPRPLPQSQSPDQDGQPHEEDAQPAVGSSIDRAAPG